LIIFKGDKHSSLFWWCIGDAEKKVLCDQHQKPNVLVASVLQVCLKIASKEKRKHIWL